MLLSMLVPFPMHSLTLASGFGSRYAAMTQGVPGWWARSCLTAGMLPDWTCRPGAWHYNCDVGAWPCGALSEYYEPSQDTMCQPPAGTHMLLQIGATVNCPNRLTSRVNGVCCLRECCVCAYLTDPCTQQGPSIKIYPLHATLSVQPCQMGHVLQTLCFMM